MKHSWKVFIHTWRPTPNCPCLLLSNPILKLQFIKKELTVLVNGFLTFNGREEELAAVHVLRDVNQLIWGTEGSAWLPLRCLEASGIMRPSGEHIRPQGVRLNHSHHCCAGTRNEQQCVRYHKWTSKWCVTPTGMPVGHHTGWVCWWYVTKKGTAIHKCELKTQCKIFNTHPSDCKIHSNQHDHGHKEVNNSDG